MNEDGGWKNGAILALAIGLIFCAVKWYNAMPPKTTSPEAAATVSPETFESATKFLASDIPVLPASGSQGDYLISSDGVWLMRGTEAMRVREVKKFTTTAPWVSATRQTVIVKRTIPAEEIEQEPIDYDRDEW